MLKEQIRKAEEAAENERRIAEEKARQRQAAEANERYELERKRREEEEAKKQLKWEEKRKSDAEARKKLQEAKEEARMKAEELRKKEEAEEEEGRKAREIHRQQALEELQRIKRLSKISISDYKTTDVDDKENIPKKVMEEPSPADNVEQKFKDEQVRLSSYAALKIVEERDSSSVKEAESVVVAARKAREEAMNAKQKIESGLSGSRVSGLEPDCDQGAVYYGAASTARRSSKDIEASRHASYIDDDLADEVEAIRLAADFSSRRLLSEQKRDQRDSVHITPATSSRLRIRQLLDKQKNMRDDEEKQRKEKRESQDITKFLWVYR